MPTLRGISCSKKRRRRERGCRGVGLLCRAPVHEHGRQEQQGMLWSMLQRDGKGNISAVLDFRMGALARLSRDEGSQR